MVDNLRSSDQIKVVEIHKYKHFLSVIRSALKDLPYRCKPIQLCFFHVYI